MRGTRVRDWVEIRVRVVTQQVLDEDYVNTANGARAVMVLEVNEMGDVMDALDLDHDNDTRIVRTREAGLTK